MKKINILLIALFLALGAATFFGLDRSKIKNTNIGQSSEAEKTEQAKKKHGFYYRGYEIDIFGRFGQKSELTGARYIVGTEEKAKQMFDVLTHDWEEIPEDQSKKSDYYTEMIHRKKPEWNVEAYYCVLPYNPKANSDRRHNSEIDFKMLDSAQGFKGDFNIRQNINFYDSQEIYEKAYEERFVIEGAKRRKYKF